MADRTMISSNGTRHRRGAPHRFLAGCYAPCNSSIILYDCEQPGAVFGRPRAKDCKSCFPSSDASLGAASTTLNPPPGEHTGDQQ